MTLTRQDKRDRFLDAIRREAVIMGVLNVTPDSFSDGGRYADPQAALQRATSMAESCAIIDIGGESTRPGFTPLAEDEERRRIMPVVDAISRSLAIAVSVDTSKASVARDAAQHGAAVINDIWGLQRDSRMAEVVAETESAAIIMHNRDAADPALDIIDDLRRFFDVSLTHARVAGVPEKHVILDPGIGFGKTFEQNLTCIAQLGRLQVYGLPILLGVSRKSFIGRILDKGVEGRMVGTLAANMVGLLRGARILRVHDVEEHRDLLRMLKAIGAFHG